MIIILTIQDGSVRTLPVQAFAIAQAATHEFRPGRHGDLRLDLLRQYPPELGMVPAEIVPGSIAMFADAGAQAFDLCDQLLRRHPDEIIIHAQPS